MSNVVRLYEYVALKRKLEAIKREEEKMKRIIDNAKAIKADRDAADMEYDLHRRTPKLIELLSLIKGDKND